MMLGKPICLIGFLQIQHFNDNMISDVIKNVVMADAIIDILIVPQS